MRTPSTAADVRLRAPTRRSGFTLIELVASMAIGFLLLGGMASAILIASHALPGRNTTTDAILRASDVVEQIAGELHCAVTFTQRSATIVEMNVPDRNADLAPETIRYAWSGTRGDPLTRQYNGGTVVNVAEDVQEFQLDYDLKTISQEGSPIQNESSETLLMSQDSPSSDCSSAAVKSDYWVGEYFLPTLPADTVSWKVTRVKISALASDSPFDGVTKVQLRLPAFGNVPSTNFIGEALMYESSLMSSFLWYTFSFTGVAELSSGQVMCLVLKTTSTDGSCRVEYASGGVSLPNAGYLEYGGSWTVNTDYALQFEVYGTITTSSGEPEVVDVYDLTGVGIKLRMGADAGTRVETAAQVLNEPEVTGP